MIKLYRGDVVWANASDGNGGLKPRPLIVYKDSKVGDDFISVYCTSQNNGNDKENIFVECESEEGENMGLDTNTYIRALDVKNFPKQFVLRKIGKCSLLPEIDRILERKMAS